MRSFLLSIVMFSLAAMGQEPRDMEIPAERLRAMRAVAERVTNVTAGPDAQHQQKLERLAEPLYRFADPAREFSDGTIWAWGRPGRPAALLTLSSQPVRTGGLRWVIEMSSLAPGPVAADVPDRGVWHPAEPGVVMRTFPGAPRPGPSVVKRSVQMRELVLQIKAHEFFKPRNHTTAQRYELRPVIRPIHRYADEASGLIDGAIFLLSYGVNPEVALLVEARREGSGEPTWRYGCARLALAELHVEFQGKEIWSHPGGPSRGPNDTYWVVTRLAEEN